MTTKSVNRLSTMLSEVLSEVSLNKTEISSVMDAWNGRKNEVSKLFEVSSCSRSSKRKKDPNAPKKWKTGYILFCVDQREKLKTQDQSLSATEITSKLGSMWKSLSEKEKAKYEALSKKDKARYENDMSSYTPSAEFVEEKQSSQKSKKDRTGPKRPLSSYMYYCQDNREIVKSQNPNMNGKEITTELGKLWKQLSDEQKVPYEAKATADKSRFESEKAQSGEKTESKSRSSRSKTTKSQPKTEGSLSKSQSKTEASPSKPPQKDVKASQSSSKSSKPAKKEASASAKKSPGFECFCEEQTDDIQSENPDWSSRKINSELLKRWQELSSDDREAYEMEAAEETEEDEILEDEL